MADEEQDIVLFAKPKSGKRRKASEGGAGGRKSESEAQPAAERKAKRPVPEPVSREVDAVDSEGPEGAPDADEAAARNGEVGPSAAATTPTSFKALGVSDWLCSVVGSMGMFHPTEVQIGCIPAVLAGRDVIGLAQTGSGKTAAFALPILQRLAQDPYGVFALMMTPTRELAIQIAEQFRALSAGMSLRDCVVIGGVDMQAQARDLSRRPHVVIATPGRLKGLMDADSSVAGYFARARFLVLDEADRLLEPGFAGELTTILSALPSTGRQTLLFSATMTKSLIKLQSASLQDAHVFQAYEGLKTAENLKEQYLFVPSKVKEVYLAHVLEQLAEHKVRSAIIFTSTCKGCHLLSLILEQLGLKCAALHSGRPQKARLAALSQFKSETVPLLLATDVASRGLDIPSVDLVINYDLPQMARDYVHRVGRTARAGRSGWSLSFVTQHDVELVHRIEEHIGHKLGEFTADEQTVLKGITKVYSAKRAAMLSVAEDEGLDTRDKRTKQAVYGGKK